MYMVKHNRLFLIRELRRFMRIEISAAMVCIGLSGYLIFNEPGPGMIFLMLAIFFAGCSSYAYNHFTDKKEDVINNRRVNIFAESSAGYCIISACVVISILSAMQLSGISFIIYIISLVAGFMYSGLRVKGLFVVKNVYTGFFLSVPFLIGAAAGELVVEMAYYFLLILIMGVTINLIGDVRGHEGDREVGLRTIPVVMGIGPSKNIININLLFFSFAVLALGFVVLIPMIPLAMASMFFLSRDDHRMTRVSMISSFLVMLLVVSLMRMMGV